MYLTKINANRIINGKVYKLGAEVFPKRNTFRFSSFSSTI